MEDALLVAGVGQPLMANFKLYAQKRSKQVIEFDPANKLHHADRVALISSISAHPCLAANLSPRGRGVGVRGGARIEDHLRSSLDITNTKLLIFRPGHILAPGNRLTRLLHTFSFCWPLIPRRFTSCFITDDELFAAIDDALQRADRPLRIFTIPGPNRPWRDVLREHGSGPLQRCLTAVTWLLSWLLLGQLVGLLFSLLTRLPSMRSWNFNTLHPESMEELLSLYNPYSFRHIKIVGYNNGVVHFGQRYPGRTVVSTVRCNRLARVNGRFAKFDGGVTIRQAVDVLHPVGKEFYVVPNYSYVALATSFFIPIHGSASDYATMGETIERVLLYDPVEDRLISARRTDPEFRERLYNLQRDTLLLRLVFRIKPKSRYFMKHEQLQHPTGQQVVAVFRDQQAANIEIRQPKSDCPTVNVRKFYVQSVDSAGQGTDGLEFPRDSLGRLWDKLEANPVSSLLFHAAVRLLGFHCELFFTPAEFLVFWDTHGRFPISKIQLRYIKRDGFPHSPFAKHDCISADMFMWRKHKPRFEQYLKETYHAVQFNPGKHSA